MSVSKSNIYLNPGAGRVIRLLTLLIGVFFIWSWSMEIEQVVRAEGRVIPSGQNKQIQHLEGGIVAEILIQEGDVVELNQPLFRIKNARAKASFQSLEIEIASLELKQTRIQAQLLDKKPAFALQKNIGKQIALDEQKLYRVQVANFKSEQAILKNAVELKLLRLEELRVKAGNLKSEHKLALKDVQLHKNLKQSGAVSQRQILLSDQAVQSIKTKMDSVLSAIPIAEAEVLEARNKLDQNQSSYKLSLQEEFSKNALKLEQFREQRVAGSERESRTEITSPVKGIVNQLYVNTQEGIIQAGDVLADVTPLDDVLIVEALIKANDRAEVWLGQSVKVKISAYDFATYGALNGKVTAISPDSSIDPQRNDFFYSAKIQVDKNNFGESKPIIPGMVAQVDVLTGKKTIFNYLVNPIHKVWQNALREG